MILEIEKGSARLHFAENSLWKKLWTVVIQTREWMDE
jgi:hypothetical protein